MRACPGTGVCVIELTETCTCACACPAALHLWLYVRIHLARPTQMQLLHDIAVPVRRACVSFMATSRICSFVATRQFAHGRRGGEPGRRVEVALGDLRLARGLEQPRARIALVPASQVDLQGERDLGV